MSEECGKWLSTSRPPKGLQQAKKHTGATSKTKLSNKIVTTTFFSAILTQNSPPPPQLLTSRKQSHLTDYFMKENECRALKNKPHLKTDAHPQLKTQEPFNDRTDIVNVSIGTLQHHHHSSQGDAEYNKVIESSDFFSPISVDRTGKVKMILSPSKKLISLNQQNPAGTQCNEKENIDNQWTLCHGDDCSLTSSGNMLINEITSKNLDKVIYPNKIISQFEEFKFARVSEGISNLDDLTNSKSNTSDYIQSEFGHESNSASLIFSSDDQFTLDESAQSIITERRIQNEEFFHARRQKHFIDMETLTFTNDSTE